MKCRAEGLEFRVYKAQVLRVSGFQGLGFRVQGLGSGFGVRVPSLVRSHDEVQVYVSKASTLEAPYPRVNTAKDIDVCVWVNCTGRLAIRIAVGS